MVAGFCPYQMTEKMGAKPKYQSTLKLSDDGRMLTETGGDLSAKEPNTVVYEKQ